MSFRERRIEAAGIAMRVCERGETSGRTPVLLLHGFTGAAESMDECAQALAGERRTLLVDLVGHGRSACPEDPRAYTMAACVEQVAAVLTALGVGRVHVLGYSMGGRVALSLAVAHPDRVASLLLVGASPGLAEASARDERVAADEELARRIERDGLEQFVDDWMALPLFASQMSRGAAFLARSREQRLASNPDGLAASLRGMGTGAMPSLHDRLREITAPVCLVAGEQDAKFVGLAQQMAGRLPRGEISLVEKAGHAAHVEDPQRFAGIARDFFARHDENAAAGPAALRDEPEVRA